MEDLSITRGSADDIPRLEPLWVAVHHQHVGSMPELAPYVSDAVTWSERRALYEELFLKTDTFLYLALVDDELVGYALVHVTPAAETWVTDTWVTGDRIAELESISVLPEHRGKGIGSMLMDVCHRRDRVARRQGRHHRAPPRQRGRTSPVRAARLPADVALPQPLRRSIGRFEHGAARLQF